MPRKGQDKLAEIARRHGVSRETVEMLARALQTGGGKLAQFNHPELGGMGQWMPGMIMIGDMFNTALKDKVNRLCTELVVLLPEIQLSGAGKSGIDEAFAWGSRAIWWPESLGTPTVSGAQNDMAYAYFPAAKRLAIKRGSEVTLYDTGDHRITGVSQQQGRVVFTGQHGDIDIGALKMVKSV